MPDLPDPISVDELPEDLNDLPELPPGYKWEIQITAETEVIRADGTVEQ